MELRIIPSSWFVVYGVSKREVNQNEKERKILLQILICVVLLAGVWMFFLNPALEKKEVLREREEAARIQQEQMQALIDNTALEDDLNVQQNISKENYEFLFRIKQLQYR